MNVVNESPPAPSLRRLPFSIRFAPEFVNCLSAILPAHGDELDRFDGLLFGILENEFAVLRIFRLFPSALTKGMQQAFETLLTQSKKDPQVAGLALLGWFSARNNVDIQPEDIAFHETNFHKTNQIALIVKSEPASQMSMEVYCRTSDGVFSEQKHRGGGIRMSNASPVVAPFELPLETKLYPDFLLVDRQAEKAVEETEPAAGWKDALATKTKKALDVLITAKPEETAASAIVNPASDEGIEFIQLDDPSSISPGLQFGTPLGGYGGAAAAPARIPQEKPETPRPVEQGREEKSPGAPVPHIGNVPKPNPPLPPPPEAVLVRSEEPSRAALSANERLARALHWLPDSEPSNIEPDHAPAAAPPSIKAASLGQLARFKPKISRDLPWRGLAALFVAAAAGTFGFIYLKNAHANGRMPGFLQALLPSPTLNMKVATVGDRFQLSWNRDNPAVRNAREAILDINDGPQHHQIQLGNAEVVNGSVLYLPNTDDVVFRLEVHGTGGQNASESLRVVGTSTLSVADVSGTADTPATGMAADRAHAAGKKATASPRASSTALSERPRHQELIAANRLASGVRKSAPASLEPRPSAPPVSAPPATKTEAADNSVTLPNSAPGNPNGIQTIAATPQPVVPPARDTAEPSPANTAATPVPEQPRVVEKPTPQASGGGVPAPAGPLNSASEQIPQAAAEPQTGATEVKPLVSYRPPRPRKQVLPKLSALPAGIAEDAVGELKIVVKVNESGHVVDARLIEGKKKVSSLLANASLAAARQWVFEPASLHGKSIASDHTILFHFRR